MDILDSTPRVLKSLWSDPYSKEIFAALSGTFFTVALVSLSVEYAASRHWSLGLMLTAASGALAMWIAMRIFRGPPSIAMVLVFFVLSVLLGAVACSGISYILHAEGWASYNVPQHVTLETFRNYYLWTFVDMVPALDLWQTFPVKSPVEPADAVAGAPVLVFRIFVLGFVFASIRQWWKVHVVGDRIESKAGGEQDSQQT